MNRLAVIGAGNWGTALAIVLSPRFRDVRIWAHEAEVIEGINRDRRNPVFLRGFPIPENVTASGDAAEVLEQAGVVLVVTPSQHLGRVISSMAGSLTDGMLFVSATKGLERASLRRMSQVLTETIPHGVTPRVAVLSGPTFAKEIAAGEPAALVVASHDRDLSRTIQSTFSGPNFRLYTSDDPTGVEIGAALKNVIAIGAGICGGLGLGNNSVAALITRGLAEITRLAVAMGGKERTMAGLAGLGDLVLTCTGELSRNRTVGVELGRGRKLEEILASTQMVAEGVETTFAALELARKHEIEMPIVEQMYEILQLGKSPHVGIRDLMERTLKSE